MCEKVFSYNQEISKTAYLNWRTMYAETAQSFYVLAESYSDATKFLIEQVLNNNADKKADSLIFPILFCFNHSIELYEKAIVLLAHQLTATEGRVPNSHNIRQLYGDMCSAIKEKQGTCKGLEKHFNKLKSYISELYEYIGVDSGRPDIDFARYPIRTDQSNHFYIGQTENIVVDIEQLKNVAIESLDSLEGIVMQYLDELETKETTL